MIVYLTKIYLTFTKIKNNLYNDVFIVLIETINEDIRTK